MTMCSLSNFMSLLDALISQTSDFCGDRWQRWLTKDTICDTCELCQATSRRLKADSD